MKYLYPVLFLSMVVAAMVALSLRSGSPDAASAEVTVIEPALPETTASQVDEVLDSGNIGNILNLLCDLYRRGGEDQQLVRMEEYLDRVWSRNPPIGLFLEAIRSQEAPAGYRLQFSHRLRDTVSWGRPDAPQLAQALRDIVITETSNPEVMIGLAADLQDMEDSPATLETLKVMARSLQSDADIASTLEIVARSGQSEAREFLWQYVQEHKENAAELPRSLAAALPPLLGDYELPLEPVLTRILYKAEDYSLFSLALKGAIGRPPSEKSISGIIRAYNRAGEFGGLKSAMIRSHCHQALAAANDYVGKNGGMFTMDTIMETQQILAASQ